MINPKQPEPWYRRGVLYQIYPLSWADANGDGYGDLRGLIEHLDYLNDGTSRSLGVAGIWLSPIYVSPMADWGYDVADHCAIDPRFGTMADFDELVREAHARGLKIVLDFVPNHTSSQHAWFQQSRSSRHHAKRDWYIWADAKPGGGAPNNWVSKFGGSAWTLDEATGQYYLHTFLAEQPDLNWRNPVVQEAMLDVLRFWLARGVDGFRTDAVGSLLKDPRLRDDPPNPNYRPAISDPSDVNLRIYSLGRPGMDELLGSICELLAEHDDALLLTETYMSIPQLQQLYRACRDHPVHAPFNFNLLALDWSAEAYRTFIDEYEASLAVEDWPNYVLGNHDRPRLVSRVGEPRARLLAFLQLTLRGLPIIYYGDELGLHSGAISPEAARDQASRTTSAMIYNRDAGRTPMPWSSEQPGAGFSEVEPWLPLSPDIDQHNVVTEERNPSSMLQLYRHLIHLRQTLLALSDGDYRSIPHDNQEVLLFVRETVHMRCYVMANLADTPQPVVIGEIGAWVAGTHTVEGDGVIHQRGTITLAPQEARLYELRRRRP